ncbi:YqhG family protein [Halobacillus litoralis]|uniref:YqhG family protein n=1 Tax=Halobacillus litoralis TaxID=45668 RepID=UPI001CD7434B|nr:YqhG family protein [Halobacillus litoralis]MCA0970103.1 YqhG family protein [Halobacillus litoralis]
MSNHHFHFVKHFFATNGCTVLKESPSQLQVQLTNDMDEQIMNRPFYWHYMKKMNREGDPMQLTFTEDRSVDGIYLHAGTPKLHTLYRTAMKNGKTARLYEATSSKGALTPWLVINFFLHFRGKQTKNEHMSLGLNLVNGAFVHHMMDRLENFSFEQKVSDYTFPMTPIIQLSSAYKRIEGYVEQYAGTLNHDWARESHEQWQQEQDLLESFYSSGDLSEDYYKNEKEQLSKRYVPRIEMDVINGGLFYLSQNSNQGILQSGS